jgi:F0F1-type ATP synthase membrane subunit b/b'
MATENVPVFNKYDGNGAATEFSIGFPYLDTSFIKVYIKRTGEEEEKLDDSRFSFVNDTTIKFPVLDTDTVLQEGEVITIQRETSLGSDYEFDNQIRLFPEEVMNADDLAFQQIQELARDLERAVKVKPTDEKTSDDLIDEVYNNLKEAIEVADRAIDAANQAQEATEKANATVEEAQKQVVEVTQAVDNAKKEISQTVSDAQAEIGTTIDEAQMDLSDTIQQAVEDVKEEAVNAAQAITDEVVFMARTWATGTDDEVQAIEKDEHSSRTYANFSMALANAPEDVPVLESTLLATDVVKGPKGDSSVGTFTGENTIEGTLNIVSDSNHPVKITGMAGTSATGYQIVDTNGLGDSDFEHYATGDRYGTKITNHNNTSNTSVSIDMYQSNVGKSVIDFSEFDTMFAPALLKTLYPVGSIYITTNTTCPLETLGIGTWELVAADRVLQGAGSRGAVGSTLEESLPNIKGSAVNSVVAYGTNQNGAIKVNVDNDVYRVSSNTSSEIKLNADLSFNASNSNAVYQDNAPVQPAAYLVNIFRRIS